MAFILDSSDAPGHMKEYGGTLMANHLLCDGSSYLVANYPNLFARIGYTFGGAGPSFNVPNHIRRVAVGSGGSPSGVLGNTVGSVGGEENHTLSIAEMPSHNHPTTGYTQSFSGSNSAPAYNGGFNPNLVDMAFTGGGGGHNNMQPSIVVLKQIRY